MSDYFRTFGNKTVLDTKDSSVNLESRSLALGGWETEYQENNTLNICKMRNS